MFMAPPIRPDPVSTFFPKLAAEVASNRQISIILAFNASAVIGR